MIDYTHEVFMVRQKGQPTTHYYNIHTKRCYRLDGELANSCWEPDTKYWNIRPIIVDLENK